LKAAIAIIIAYREEGGEVGEAKLKKSATQKFVEQFPLCSLCGGERASTTREHMPPKSLFDQSHRPDKLVMPACAVCNGGTSKADLTAAMVSRWNYNSPHQEREDHSRLANQVRILAEKLRAITCNLVKMLVNSRRSKGRK
jgi:hypothetical protein